MDPSGKPFVTHSPITQYWHNSFHREKLKRGFRLNTITHLKKVARWRKEYLNCQLHTWISSQEFFPKTVKISVPNFQISFILSVLENSQTSLFNLINVKAGHVTDAFIGTDKILHTCLPRNKIEHMYTYKCV